MSAPRFPAHGHVSRAALYCPDCTALVRACCTRLGMQDGRMTFHAKFSYRAKYRRALSNVLGCSLSSSLSTTDPIPPTTVNGVCSKDLRVNGSRLENGDLPYSLRSRSASKPLYFALSIGLSNNQACDPDWKITAGPKRTCVIGFYYRRRHRRVIIQ
jgi:hypothetical protein